MDTVILENKKPRASSTLTAVILALANSANFRVEWYLALDKVPSRLRNLFQVGSFTNIIGLKYRTHLVDNDDALAPAVTLACSLSLGLSPKSIPSASLHQQTTSLSTAVIPASHPLLGITPILSSTT